MAKLTQLANDIWAGHTSIIELPHQSYNVLSTNEQGEELHVRIGHPTDHRLLVAADKGSKYGEIFGTLSREAHSQFYMYSPEKLEDKASDYGFTDWEITFSWGSEGNHEYDNQSLPDIFAHIIRESKSSYCRMGICSSDPSTHDCKRVGNPDYREYKSLSKPNI